MFFEELVSEDAWLGDAIYTTVDFELKPTISDRVKKVIFINELLRNFRELGVNVFRTV